MINSIKKYCCSRYCRGTLNCPGSGGFAHRGQKAFTLIELLVVISIIAILLAVVMPSLRMVKQQARKVICLSNMRQTGVALQTYFVDVTTCLPPSSCHVTDPDKFWLNVLSKYTNEQLLLHCPSDKSKNFVDWNLPLSEQTDKRYSSFAVNALVDPVCYRYSAKDNKYNDTRFIHDTEFCIWISEAPETDDFLQADHIHPESWEGSPEYAKTFIAYDRHMGKSNYLFTDGRAETLQFEDTYAYPGECYWYPETAPKWPDNP